MKKRLIFICFYAVFILVVVLLARMARRADANPNNPDFIAVQTTLRTVAQIKDQARYTIDDSHLSEVMTNDLRAGFVDDYDLKCVRYIKGNPNLNIWEVGYLDSWQARYAFLRKVKYLYDAAVARGEIKILPIPTDNDILPTPFKTNDPMMSPEDWATQQTIRTHVTEPDVMDVPEIRELERTTGCSAGLPLSPTVIYKPTGFTLLSVSVVLDLAYARVEWDYGLADDTLVKRHGKWYLVGEKVLSMGG